MKKDISYLSKTNIVAGKLINLAPELYELQQAVENSADGWHDHESVFDHTLSVMSALEKILSNYRKLKRIFNKKIDKNTKKILLKVTTIFHDIGKKGTMVEQDGFTRCPGHEELGVKMTKEILKSFDISEKETQFVLDIIANHTEFHKLLSPDNPNFQKDFVNIKNKFGKYIYPELIVLSYADTVNSKLRKANPKEFRYRIDFYKREIEKLS